MIRRSLLGLVLCLSACRAESHGNVSLVLGESRVEPRVVEVRSAFAEYLVLPDLRNELRITLGEEVRGIRPSAEGFVVATRSAAEGDRQRVRIAQHREAMRASLAAALGTATGAVSIKGKTNEGMGFIGRGEGLACIAVATLVASE